MSGLYSYQGGAPAPFPKIRGSNTAIIRLPNGVARTDEATFTEAEIEAAGYTGPHPIPDYDPPTEHKPAWNGTTWIVAAKSSSEKLEAERAEKVAGAEAKAQSLINAGFNYEIPGSGNLYTYSISDRIQAHMNSIFNRLTGGGAGPADGVWADIDDVDRVFTDEQWTAFAEAASDYKEGILRTLRLLLRDIAAASNNGAMGQIDIEAGEGNNNPTPGENASGWPANGS